MLTYIQINAAKPKAKAWSLADARVRRDEAKKKIAQGIDPALEKKRARIAAQYAAANTFEGVAKEWLVKCERDGLAPVTVDTIRWLLAKAYPLIGTISIAQITPHEALAVLRKVEAHGVCAAYRAQLCRRRPHAAMPVMPSATLRFPHWDTPQSGRPECRRMAADGIGTRCPSH